MTWDLLLNRDAAVILGKINDFRNAGGFPGFPEFLLGQMPRYRLNPQDERDIVRFRRMLALRCRIAPATVKKWLDGSDAPGNREQAKEVGLALDMTEPEVNVLLRLMKFRPLYVKTPVDQAYIMVLAKYDTIKVSERLKNYKDAAKRAMRLLRIKKKKDADRATPAIKKMQAIRSELDQVMTNDDYYHWVESKCCLLATFEKDERTSWEIMNFVRLFLGNEPTHTMWGNDIVSTNVRNLLNGLNEDSPILLKGLRNRFICFGLFLNFTAADIDDMLKMKGLPLITEPNSGLGIALLELIQNAHFSYPYEFSMLLRALNKIRYIENGAGAHEPGGASIAATKTRKAFHAERMECYRRRLRDASRFFNDYNNAPQSEEERIFAEYAADSGCVADYVMAALRSMLDLELSDIGILTADDVLDIRGFLSVMKTMALK